ncbi:MAG TPA: hypothetical protein VLB44_23605, partial [Kofleriaceae bacterium]|nr:hypothetical protein [Kofleriaceae bacterium]
MGLLDRLRAKAHDGLTKLPGRAGELAKRANDALGRPLADETELADRRAFSERGPAPAPKAAPTTTKVAAPVI